MFALERQQLLKHCHGSLLLRDGRLQELFVFMLLISDIEAQLSDRDLLPRGSGPAPLAMEGMLPEII